MAPSRSPEHVASVMLYWHDLDLVSCTELQTLWAGYGHICAVSARATTDDAAKHLDELCGTRSGTAGSVYPLILKLISPPAARSAANEGHLRKMLSYEVEQRFYTRVAPRLGDDVAVARCLASTADCEGRPRADELSGATATIMTDLRSRFPVSGEKRTVLNRMQVRSSILWLAGFHRSSWRWLPDRIDDHVLPPLDEAQRRRSGTGEAGTKLWLNGGYTYLATRRDEYASLAEDTGSEWSDALCRPLGETRSSVAETVAQLLTPRGRPHETYIHGDVKSENLFTTRSGDAVAFFDFQYVGLGLGVCDLAKLFTCSVPVDMLLDDDDDDDDALPDQLPMRDGERRLLEDYRAALLRDPGSRPYSWDLFTRHWESALVDWCRFQASWGFWGNTEWLEARVRSILADQEWRDWLRESVQGPN